MDSGRDGWKLVSDNTATGGGLAMPGIVPTLYHCSDDLIRQGRTAIVMKAKREVPAEVRCESTARLASWEILGVTGFLNGIDSAIVEDL